MKTPARQRALSLVELLVVIAIIGILASLVVTGIGITNTKVKIASARLQMAELQVALKGYEARYGNLPFSPSVLAAGVPDFTYGAGPVRNGGAYEVDNRELIAVLTDITQFRNGTPTVNVNHSLNPARRTFLHAPIADAIGRPGIGPDGVYRDPWGQPYIITLDLDFDGRCLDAMYRRENVSQQSNSTGFKALSRPNGQVGDHFGLQAQIMIWSFGPDRSADPNLRADQDDPNTMMGNQDNVLGWVE